MLFSPSVRLGSGPEGSPAPPSSYLKLPQGRIVSAWEVKESPHGKRAASPSFAQRAGLAYQKKIERFLAPRRPSDWTVYPSLWFVYCDDRPGRNYCSPDFILDCGADLLVVVEAKIRWTADAYYQLEQLYLPVLRVARPRATLVPLCITKSFDPAIKVPMEVRFVSDVFEASPGKFNLQFVR